MTLINEDSAVILKTRELCETLAAQSAFQHIRQRIDAFKTDENARLVYEDAAALSQNLQYKQQMGQPLSDQEVSDFEIKRQGLLDNPVTRGYLEAQEEMQAVRQSITMYVMKTFELGRLPEPSDFHGCRPGCSCG